MVRGVSYFRSFRKTNNSSGDRVTSSDTDESCLTDSELGSSGSEPSVSTGGHSNVEFTSKTELGSSLSSETQFDSGQKGWFSKKRKWFSAKPTKRKVEPFIDKTIQVNADPIAVDNHLSDSTQVHTSM